MRMRMTVFAGLVLGISLLASAATAQAPGAVPLDWPMGTNDGTQLLPGYGIRVLQNFANSNPTYGGRLHSAIDLSLDAGSASGANVYAAADGVVTCTSTAVSYPGRVIVVEHTLSNGTKIHTMYGHLNQTVYVSQGQIVNRGTPLATVVYQTLSDGSDNSHLHFEVRTFKDWAPGNCWGPGYADSGKTPPQQGWLDPIAEYFARRPSFPGNVVSNIPLNIRTAPSLNAGVITQVAAGSRLVASGVYADQGGTANRWYRVRYDGVNWGYACSYQNFGWGGDLLTTELRRNPDPVGLADVGASNAELYVFARYSDRTLLYNKRTSAGAWVGWASLGGGLTSNPVVAKRTDRRLAVFVRGSDNNVYYRAQTAVGGGFAGWVGLGGLAATSAPAAISNSDGRLQVFVRDRNGALQTRYELSVDGSWSGWQSLGGILSTAPAAGINSDGRLDVFVGGLNNALHHIAQTTAGGGFGGWQYLGGTTSTTPVVVSNDDGRLELFVRSASFDLRHAGQTSPGGAWSGWTSLGGILTTGPAVAVNNDGRLEALARANDGRVVNIWQLSAGGAWSTTWGSLDGYATSAPVVTRQGGYLQTVVRGTDNGLYHRAQTSTGWSGWVGLGGPFMPY